MIAEQGVSVRSQAALTGFQQPFPSKQVMVRKSEKELPQRVTSELSLPGKVQTLSQPPHGQASETQWGNKFSSFLCR